MSKAGIRPEHIRAAIMSAAGRDLKFGSLEWTEYIAEYINRFIFEEDNEVL